MDDTIRQVMEFAACDAATAHRLLQQHGGNAERAIMAVIAEPSLGQQGPPSPAAAGAALPQQTDMAYKAWAGQSNVGATRQPQHPQAIAAHGWDDVPSSVQQGPQQPAQSQQQQQKQQQPSQPSDEDTWADRAGGEALRRSPRSAKRRSSPVDLTADDEDDDLRKAMQASLESENDRQKRQQYHGPARAPKTVANEEEEQLTRAIEASMLQSSAATRPQSPALSETHLEAIGDSGLRSPGQPIAILAPSPFMRLFAVALQAMNAAEPLQKAFLSWRFKDIRLLSSISSLGKGMEGYWRGDNPAGQQKASPELWQESKISSEMQDKADVLMRLNTLLVFMAFSKRLVCLADDVITYSPVRKNYAYTMNSERKAPGDILACYVDGVVSMLADVVTHSETSKFNGEEASDILSAFVSSTVLANTAGDALQGQQVSEPFEFTVHHLQRSSINSSMHRAIHAHLADEKALYHKLGRTLFFSISDPHSISSGFGAAWEQPSLSNSPFRVESSLYLDLFTSVRRNGEQLGSDSEAVKQGQSRIEDLEKYKKTISLQQGDDTRALLRSSIAYFRKQCSDDGSDALRTASIKEALPRLEGILTRLEEEIASTEERLRKARAQVDGSQDAKLKLLEENLTRPENQTLRYDLQALVRADGDSAWVYVRNRDELRENASTHLWWRITDGQAYESTEQEVVEDSGSPVFLIYTAHEDEMETAPRPAPEGDSMDRDDKPAKTVRIDSVRNWWLYTPLVEAIERDNAALGTRIARQMQQQQQQQQQQQHARSMTGDSAADHPMSSPAVTTAARRDSL